MYNNIIIHVQVNYAYLGDVCWGGIIIITGTVVILLLCLLEHFYVCVLHQMQLQTQHHVGGGLILLVAGKSACPYLHIPGMIVMCILSTLHYRFVGTMIS